LKVNHDFKNLGPFEKYDMITGTLCSLQCPVSQKNEDHNPV